MTGTYCAVTPNTPSARFSAVSVVVPGITAMRLPVKSAQRCGGSLARTRALPPSTKMGRLKSTRSIRDSVIVVVPHSASTLPATTSDSRVSLSTGTHSTLRFGSLSAVAMAAATFSHNSTE